MKISAKVSNSHNKHEVLLQTNDHSHALSVPPKEGGYGSSANGGELLFLALASCYCNDIYREAANMGIKVNSVEVEVSGDFGGPGDPATNVTYSTRVEAEASKEEIDKLCRHTDTVAEIQNSLRVLTEVSLASIEAVSV